MSDKILINKIDKFIGLSFPLSNSQHGYFNPSLLTKEQISSNILSILSTNKGERLMRPSLGLNVSKYVFNKMNVAGLEDKLRQDIQIELSKWIKNIKILNLSVFSAEDNEFSIKLTYAIGDDIYEELEFSIIGLQPFYGDK